MKLFMFFFRLVNCFVPKSGSLICLSSFPDYDDQVRALVSEIIDNTDCRIVILTDNLYNPPAWADNKRISHLKKYSLKGVWSYFRSKFVFFTHGCFSSVPTVKSQTCVNVWHGMPIKKIGHYIDKNHRISYSDYITTTSPFFSDIFAYAFNMPKGKMLEVGIPRNDILLRPRSDKIVEMLGRDKKIIVWLPTYRNSVVGEIRLDGEIEQNIFNMPDLNIDALNQVLKDMDAVAIVKPHPMAMKHAGSDEINRYSNIKFINEEWLLENSTTLYEVLAQSDLLITDVSSVLIDYLVLEKPIICHFPDINAYKNSRGLIWDFKPQEYGIPVVCTQQELLSQLKSQLEGNFEKEKLLELKKLAHGVEGGFTKRLLDYLAIGDGK